jgi:uncharacterized C2H2 Zn-finger protein
VKSDYKIGCSSGWGDQNGCCYTIPSVPNALSLVYNLTIKEDNNVNLRNIIICSFSFVSAIVLNYKLISLKYISKRKQHQKLVRLQNVFFRIFRNEHEADNAIEQNVPAVKKLLSCQQCNKTFGKKSKLAIHMRVHTGEKPYSCTLCGKSFAQSGQLSYHRQYNHTEVVDPDNTKMLSCSQCSKLFVRKNDLNRHMRVHTGERPYSCTLCSKSFARTSLLYRHKRVHTGEKPYSCTVCGKSFARSIHLNEHMRVHTGEKPFSCSLCDKSFARISNLGEHRRKCHVEKIGRNASSWIELNFYVDKTIYNSAHPVQYNSPKSLANISGFNECGQSFAKRNRLNEHMRVHTGCAPNLFHKEPKLISIWVFTPEI